MKTSNYRSAKLVVIGALMLGIPLWITQSTAGASEQQQEELGYMCPMHPEVKSTSAGTCPKCGMPLKQKVETSAASSSTRWGANYFPNVNMVTQDGKTVRFYDDLLKDKVVLSS